MASEKTPKKKKRLETDPFIQDIHNPIHENIKRFRKRDLEKIEDEMWLP